MRWQLLILAIVLSGAAYFVGVRVTENQLPTNQKEVRSDEQVSERLNVTKIPVSRELWAEILTDAQYLEGDNPRALTIVAYLSRDQNCPDCQVFLEKVLPRIREKYITNGRVRYLELPANSGHSKAAGMKTNPSFFVGIAKVEGAQPYITFESLIEKALGETK